MGEFWRLVGATLLGALISFGTTFYFERRKEQRTEKAEQQERTKKIRQATRLVWAELIDAIVPIDIAVENRQWWSDPPHDLKTEQLSKYQSILASLLDDRVWWDTSSSHRSINRLNVQLAMARDGKDVLDLSTGLSRGAINGSEVSEAWQQSLERFQTEIQWGIDSLRPIVRPDQPTLNVEYVDEESFDK